MKTQIQILTAIAALAFCGCASVEPGEDAVVVRAEQLAEIAVETIDGFIHYEWMNRDALWQISPEFKGIADQLRAQSTPAIKSLRVATLAYKTNQTEANRLSLVTATAVLQVLLTETEKHFARAIAEK